MKFYAPLILLFLLLNACGKDDNLNREKRFLDKIVINKAPLSGWDVLSGPDIKVSVEAEGIENESEVLEDVILLPITLNDVAIELTDSTLTFRIWDYDEFDPDDLMFDKRYSPYFRTDSGNPFLLTNSDWEIEVHWIAQ